MARNAEKAMTTLARWRAAQLAESGKNERRPRIASECNSISEAEKWRGQIIREVCKQVAEIQNAGLGEYRIRDLNDEINKKLREKRHWEFRIRELGGPDYARGGPRTLDHEGREVPGNRGYKYFGAAKDLPGVRELFERTAPPPPRKTKAELMKDIDADYYGYLDEDDGLLVPLESEAEEKAIAEAIGQWTLPKDGGSSISKTAEEDIYAVVPESDSEEEMEVECDKVKEQSTFVAHVPIPSQKEVEEALLRRKKQQLMEKYASETLQQETKRAKMLMGYENS